MTIEEAHHHLTHHLNALYASREANNIANMVIEKISGHSPTARIIHKKDMLTAHQDKELDDITTSLLKNIPIQYILNEAWFFGMPFYVDSAVLIPRPETEELVEWILNSLKAEQPETGKPVKILDIGTGSGCIAIALKKKYPLSDIWAIDKYPEALQVARKNADILKADIHFIEADILSENYMQYLPDNPDIIVSNPPYIPLNERKDMDKNIVGREPDTALFVPDNDPLIFYKKIRETAEKKLNPGGKIFVEIHENLGEKVRVLFEEKFRHVTLKKDISGKDRMVRAIALP